MAVNAKETTKNDGMVPTTKCQTGADNKYEKKNRDAWT